MKYGLSFGFDPENRPAIYVKPPMPADTAAAFEKGIQAMTYSTYGCEGSHLLQDASEFSFHPAALGSEPFIETHALQLGHAVLNKIGNPDVDASNAAGIGRAA